MLKGSPAAGERAGGERLSGEVRGSQAELTFSPEEELQLLARAGPRASRAGPTASPPPFLPPLSFPFPPFLFFLFYFFVPPETTDKAAVQ